MHGLILNVSQYIFYNFTHIYGGKDISYHKTWIIHNFHSNNCIWPYKLKSLCVHFGNHCSEYVWYLWCHRHHTNGRLELPKGLYICRGHDIMYIVGSNYEQNIQRREREILEKSHCFQLPQLCLHGDALKNRLWWHIYSIYLQSWGLWHVNKKKNIPASRNSPRLIFTSRFYMNVCICYWHPRICAHKYEPTETSSHTHIPNLSASLHSARNNCSAWLSNCFSH